MPRWDKDEGPPYQLTNIYVANETASSVHLVQDQRGVSSIVGSRGLELIGTLPKLQVIKDIKSQRRRSEQARIVDELEDKTHRQHRQTTLQKVFPQVNIIHNIMKVAQTRISTPYQSLLMHGTE